MIFYMSEYNFTMKCSTLSMVSGTKLYLVGGPK